MTQKLRTALGTTAAIAVVVGAAAAWAIPAGAAAAASGGKLAMSQQAQLALLAEQDVRAGAPGVIVQIRDHGKPEITISRHRGAVTA